MHGILVSIKLKLFINAFEMFEQVNMFQNFKLLSCSCLIPTALQVCFNYLFFIIFRPCHREINTINFRSKTTKIALLNGNQ